MARNRTAPPIGLFGKATVGQRPGLLVFPLANLPLLSRARACSNSWTPQWGDHGYIKLKRATNAGVVECGACCSAFSWLEKERLIGEEQSSSNVARLRW
jgi:hypothetical protein